MATGLRRFRGGAPAVLVGSTVAAAGLFFVWAAGRNGPRTGADPEAVIRANNRGAALMEQFKHARAIEEFGKVTAAAPRWAPGFVNLGLAALYVRDAERAEKAFREAIRLDPNLIQGHYGLGILLKDEGRTEEAIASMEKARALDPRDAHILYYLGLLHVRTRNFDKAVGLLQEARALDPNSLSIRYQLARALLQLGRRAAGEREMAVYQELASDPRFAVPTGSQYGEAGHYALVVTDYSAFGGPPPRPEPIAVRFVEVTRESGIRFVHAGPGGEAGAAEEGDGPKALAARYGSGVAVGDFDGDGLPDLVFANASADGRARPALYRNRGDWTFEDVTAKSGVSFRGVGMAATLADYDSDGDLDLFLTRLGGGALYRNRGGGSFSDVTAASGLSLSGFCLGASWADVDHDGDLDLYVSRLPLPGPVRSVRSVLLLNRGDGTFREATAELGMAGPLEGSVGAVFSDLDLDRDIDVVLSTASGRNVLLDNRREKGFADRTRPAGLAGAAGARGVSAGDLDGDGFQDLVFAAPAAGGLRLYLNGGDGRFKERALGRPEGSSTYGTVLFDADNDGDLDLFATGSAHLLYLNDGSGRFQDVTRSFGLSALRVRDGRGAATGDLDADGDLDLVVTRNGGPPALLRNDGGNRNYWLEVRPRGLNSNRDGVGTRVELQAGAFWQRREVRAGSGYLSQSPAWVHFGMRRRGVADVLRLLWPGGVLQAELDVSRGQALEIEEIDRKGSSCPVLFAWDGGRYRFVADFLGVGGLGLWLGPGVYGKPDPDEYVKIEPHQLLPRDGGYYLQVVENLEEVTYLDQTRLIAIDHPRGIDVYPNERFPTAEEPPHRLYAIDRGARLFPVRATAHNGRDVTGRVLEIDRRYPDEFRLRRLAGYAEMHHLDLLFPESVVGQDGLVLFLYGWVDFEYSSSNFAAAQSGLVLTPPILEFEGADRLFEPALDPMGFPPGLPRMMTVDLSETGPLPTPRIRIRTNMRVYWDQVFLARPMGGQELSDKVRVQEVRLSGAHLHRRGYPREHSPDGREPKIYDYGIIDNTQPFKVMTGDYTRFGRVTELLRRTDDRFVIFGKGEEVTLEFPVKGLEATPRGWQRSFFLYASGFCKDMDPHTAFPDTVEPLPFRAMSAYPYPAGESYPDDREHREYRRRYNTRHLEGR
ncbi:MAG: FG-GAP-like repeat-containing protein [Acidobacteriota bacterium]